MVRVLIERRRTGALAVQIDPPVPQLRKIFIQPVSREKRFWRAAGYGAALAARYGLALIDRTGRLTEEDCKGLVQIAADRALEVEAVS